MSLQKRLESFSGSTQALSESISAQGPHVCNALPLTYGEHPLPSLCLPVFPGEFDGLPSGAVLEELEQGSMPMDSFRWG